MFETPESAAFSTATSVLALRGWAEGVAVWAQKSYVALRVVVGVAVLVVHLEWDRTLEPSLPSAALTCVKSGSEKILAKAARIASVLGALKSAKVLPLSDAQITERVVICCASISRGGTTRSASRISLASALPIVVDEGGACARAVSVRSPFVRKCR